MHQVAVFGKEREKLTSYNNCVDIACDFSAGRIHIDTTVDTRILCSQVADGDSEVGQRSTFLNPLFVSVWWGDFIRWPWHGVIVKYFFHSIKLSTEIHPNVFSNAGRTSCRGTFQDDTLTRLSGHWIGLCRGRDKLLHEKVKTQPSALLYICEGKNKLFEALWNLPVSWFK